MNYYLVTPDYPDAGNGILDSTKLGTLEQVIAYSETLASESGYYGAVDIDGQIILADCYGHLGGFCEHGAHGVPCPGHRVGTVESVSSE